MIKAAEPVLTAPTFVAERPGCCAQKPPGSTFSCSTRLFLVPAWAAVAEGAYLAYPFPNLLGHLMLECMCAETAVVGEDLGTAPEGLRAALAATQVLSYRVMRFERDGEGFVPPGRYPRLAAACVATHNLPPLAGWWEGTDLTERRGLVFLPIRRPPLPAPPRRPL